MEQNKLFAETPPLQLFLRAAIPGAIAMLASMLYDTADGILVGRFLGADTFAAVTISLPLVIMSFAVSDLVGVGSSAVIAVEHGKHNFDRANDVFTLSVIMIHIGGFVLGAIFFLFAPGILILLGAKGELVEQGSIYLRVYASFLPLISINYAADNFLKICGMIRRSMMLSFIIAILGTVLEFFFLAVLRLDVAYSALGYCIAMLFSAVFGMWPFLHNKQILKFVPPHFSWELVREVCANGLAVFLQNISGRIYSLIMNSTLLALGGANAVTTYGVIFFSAGIITPLVYGEADAVQPAIGYNWGAKNKHRVIALTRYVFIAGGLIGLTSAALMFLCPELLVHLFIPDATPELFAMAVPALRTFSGALCINWIYFCTQEFVIALKLTKISSVISVLATFVFPVTAIALLAPFGLNALWYAPVVGTILTVITSIAILVHIRNKHFNGIPVRHLDTTR
ncbi:MATE family efflux transporter [Atopobium sp. oral taxon 199]|uniref:MATE family efflux transporter n=1 Tax=Atopobium sp. oral taxon 199 TaxID=712156 RepID=UPI00034EA391|nr:MATE family efflux transporter [Atopobium sp. oral taxon 199]EPD77721.1 hypothetical protein HMPREF1527_00019 [Atopobium sp. oral taxon 199 str. F0494]